MNYKLDKMVFFKAMNDKGIYSNAELARQTGLHPNTISRLINNGGNPCMSKAFAIAEVLGVTIDELWVKK